MSKVLVIPDTHLKPKMFDLADLIMAENKVDYAVQLGDNVDDFYAFEDDYRSHNARMVLFNHEHPNTIWLWGNHELSYLLDRPVTGNVYCGKSYARLYNENFNPKFIHSDGRVVFSHAGIFQEFLRTNKLDKIKRISTLIKKLNELEARKYWNDFSPIWARHEYDALEFPEVLEDYLQIIGHTPATIIHQDDNVVSTDVFSTNWGKKIGQEQMIIVDTETREYKTIDINYRRRFNVD